MNRRWLGPGPRFKLLKHSLQPYGDTLGRLVQQLASPDTASHQHLLTKGVGTAETLKLQMHFLIVLIRTEYKGELVTAKTPQ